MESAPPAEEYADADLLVGYLMREGVPIKPEVLMGLARGSAPDAGGLTDQEKSIFYGAYSELAKLASPVTAESLRACSDERAGTWKKWPWSTPQQLSLAERAVQRHHTWAFVALIVLLIVQIYWLIGASLISGIKQQNNDTGTEQSTPAAQTTSAEATTSNVQTSPAPAAATTAASTDANESEEEAREDTHLWLLSVWSAVWKWVPDVYRYWFPNEDITSNARWELSISAKFVLDILQTYLLPLLYGWLGAMAFVLRSLIAAVKFRTFRPQLNVEYRLRVYLGLLAGLVIGWFMRSNGNSGELGVADLTPAAVSFLAGYSVEILFSTMDRIVSGFVAAFGGSTVETPQRPRS
jgi:hypothetical protein